MTGFSGSSAPPDSQLASDQESWRFSPWGIREAAWGWVMAVVLGAIVGGLVISAAGYGQSDQAGWPLWLVAVTQVPLWIGLLGAPLYAAYRSRSTVVAEFGFRFRPLDVPVGLVIGVAGQFLLVPAISYPWLALWGKKPSDLSQTAEQLVSKAHDPLGVVLLVAIVVVGAPFIEELFYRGLLLRSLRKLTPDWASIVLCGLVFGVSHFELLGLPALAGFGMVLAYLAVRTGRLGVAIAAHVGFNAVTVWSLLR